MAKRISVISLLLLLTARGFSQTGGDNVYEFLNLTQSGLVSSLGGTNVSLAESSLNLAWTNPALLSRTMSGNVALNFTNYLAGVNYGMALYSHASGKSAVVAGGVSYLNYGSFDEADETGAITGSFSASESSLALIYALRLDSQFSVGVNFKPVISQLERYNSIGFAFDLGASWHNPGNFLSAGFAVRNLGLQLTSYAGESKAGLPLEVIAGFSARLRHAPFRFSLTLRHLELFDLTHNYDGSGGENRSGMKDITENILRHVVTGVEIIPHRNLWLTVGYNHQRRSELQSDLKASGTGFSWGFGINASVMRIEFGRASYHLAGASNNISVIFMPDRMFKKQQL
ncbi:MAG TPA: hypothetical protein DCY25_10830 [Bacteroidales bacterium]|nr:hypothetical protein [Bacteroidales bacterium]